MKPLHIVLKELAYMKNVHEIEITKDPILTDRGYYEFFKTQRQRVEPQSWVKFNNHYRNDGRGWRGCRNKITETSLYF